MKNELGEVFYDGKIINLSNADIGELNNVLTNLKNNKVQIKEKIDDNLNQMMGE